MTAIEKSDVDFLRERFSALTTRRNFALPSEYVEGVRYMPPDLTPFPGRFSFRNFPYFREIIDCFSPASPVRKVYVMKGNQLGATTDLLENILLYGIGCNPSPMLYVLPDEAMAKVAMETKIDRMIDNSGLRSAIFAQTKKARGAKATGDTSLKKEFVGGYLHAVGGRSGNRFRNFSYKIILVDELDGMTESIKGEGTMEDLAIARSDAYPTTRKIYFGSTPTVEQTSKIYRLYEAGDKRRYFVPCRYCGEMQALDWSVYDEARSRKIGGIVFDLDGNFMPILESVGYKCRHCGRVMKNDDKALIMSKGEWRAQKLTDEPNTRSYHLSPLYNPPGMFSWEDMVSLFAKCWDFRLDKMRDKESYRSFRNLKQGLPFREMSEQILSEKVLLHKRTGFASHRVPNEMAEHDAGSPVRIVTCAVDVQKDRLYVDVKGFSDRGVTWTLDFFAIEGATETAGADSVWGKLARYIEGVRFSDESGRQYAISITLVDSGHYTDYVYNFCGQFSGGVYACKGVNYILNGETYQLFNKKTLEAVGLPLAYHINTSKLKDRIAISMKSSEWKTGELQSDWHPNFPEDFRDDYFAMFEAEEKVEEFDKKTNRYIRTIWKQIDGKPNHAFDTYVYNLAALEIYADDVCRNELQIGALDWDVFWQWCGELEKV